MQNLTAAIKLYRTEHPSSRAVNAHTVYGSGSGVRRATCIFCRCQIATCSAKWRPTKRYLAAIEQHSCDEMTAYLARSV